MYQVVYDTCTWSNSFFSQRNQYVLSEIQKEAEMRGQKDKEDKIQGKQNGL